MSKKGRHKTVPKELKPTIAWLESFDEIKRVIIGISESCRHTYTPGTIRVRSAVLGGLSVNGYGGNGVTDIYVCVSPLERIDDVVAMIEERFGG